MWWRCRDGLKRRCRTVCEVIVPKNLAWRLFSKISIFLYDLLHRRAVVVETELIDKLRDDFRRFVPRQSKDNVYIEGEWEENMNCLRESILSKDPSNFLRWNVIRRTMSVGHAPYVRTELKYLKRRQDWNGLLKSAITESSTGKPIPFPLHPCSSGNLIHQAYHLSRFEEITRIGVDKVNFIFEFGGGYGAMCRLVHNLGFKGKYLIFDLPPFSSLQKFFLRSSKMPVHTIDTFMRADSGVVCISDIEELNIILDNQRDETDSLFVATWSISEVPVSLRNMILPLISSFGAYLIAFQDRFGAVNKNEFFEKWKEHCEIDVIWHDLGIEHILGNNYLFGSRSY